MFRVLVFILIAAPLLEVWGLITAGKWIGPWPTVLLVIVTGVAGGYLARWQGMQVLNLVRIQLSRGELPGDTLMDGLFILVGGLSLLAPGFFTDVFGLLLLLPYTRGVARLLLKRKLLQLIEEGRIHWYARR